MPGRVDTSRRVMPGNLLRGEGQKCARYSMAPGCVPGVFYLVGFAGRSKMLSASRFTLVFPAHDNDTDDDEKEGHGED